MVSEYIYAQEPSSTSLDMIKQADTQLALGHFQEAMTYYKKINLVYLGTSNQASVITTVLRQDDWLFFNKSFKK